MPGVVASSDSLANVFQGLCTLDAYGGVNPDDSPPVESAAYWVGWKIARAAHNRPGAISPQSGLILDGYGGLHPYGRPLLVNAPAYWSGWDIARAFAFLPDGSGGYVLDGYGGLHAFSVDRFGQRGFAVANGLPPPTQGGPHWSGWDIARKVVIFDDGTGGGGVFRFGGGDPLRLRPPPPPPPRLPPRSPRLW